jgi:YVTN family beta-propeller protein
MRRIEPQKQVFQPKNFFALFYYLFLSRYLFKLKNSAMKNIITVFLLLIFCLEGLDAQVSNATKTPAILPTGWALTPAGKSLPLGDFPMHLAVSKSGKWMVATNNGQGLHSLQLIDVKNQRIEHDFPIGTGWLGLDIADDEKTVYVSGGNENCIYRYQMVQNRLSMKDTIRVGVAYTDKISLTGLCIDNARRRVYITSKESNKLYVLDTDKKTIVHEEDLGAAAYTCVLTRDKKFLLISIWGSDQLYVWNCDSRKVEAKVKVGDNPNDIAVHPDGKRVFVANANDNTVSVVDLVTKKVVETLEASLFPNAPTGSTTNSVAISTNGKELYIANADNNCLAVFDISIVNESRSKGFIPVGWYPTCVRIVDQHLFVANGKGVSSFANPNGPNPLSVNQAVAWQKGDTSSLMKIQYIGNLMKGSLSIIKQPDEKAMKTYTSQVYQNSPYKKEQEWLAEGELQNPIPMRVGDASPIKHVFYIIKENRTYDQVLGDMPQGNGDTSLCLFPEAVTPNQHALAKEFVLLDNFYVAAEVSADGHNWSMAGYANDFVEKTWIQSYGRRGGEYVYEGEAPIAYPRDGFIFDHCLRKGKTFRTYGEFADNYKPNYPTIKNHYCPYYTSWDTDVRDTTRVRQWRQDFDSLLAINAVPQFNCLRLINDHTEGLRTGKPSPNAQVADNDMAVGLFIEHLSNSSIWKESAVFILEDDAQNGADHVDAHRSIAFVVSPYTKRNYHDSTLYTTNSMLRTIELILGLAPMSQQDAGATPMWRCFTKTPDFTPFKHLIPKVDLNEINPSYGSISDEFELFDFSQEDSVPDLRFNQLLWLGLKGTEMPAPRRMAWVITEDEDE